MKIVSIVKMKTIPSKAADLSTQDSPSEFSETHAFPRELAILVGATAARLAKGQMHPPSYGYEVHLRGESLNIPCRVYYDKEKILKFIGKDELEDMVALCLGTRHFDGFVREKCVRRLLKFDAHWLVPFIVQLLGEYVIEIVIPIEDALSGLDNRKYSEFLIENASYFGTTERRAISYWAVYYRERYPEMREYPAIRAIAALKLVLDTKKRQTA